MREPHVVWNNTLSCYFEVACHAFLWALDLSLGSVNLQKTTGVGLFPLRVVNNDLGEVSQGLLDEVLEHWLVFGLHGRGGVDFDEPDAQVLVDHEVVAKELKAVFAVVHHVLHAQGRRLYLLLYLLEDHLIKYILFIRILVFEVLVQVI